MLRSLFRQKKSFEGLLTTTDIHSHLLPGIDDGVETIDESLEVIAGFKALGYKKLITTPHIMYDFYKNNPEIILEKLAQVKNAMTDADLDLVLEAAAEYYLDEHFLETIESGAPILSFGDDYVLFELSFVSKPMTLKEVAFKLQTRGYKPVLAHVERYQYFHRDFEALQDLHDSGIIFQLNLLSLSGYYSKPVKQMSKKLINEGLISFVGSDCHNLRHLQSLGKTLDSNEMNMLTDIKLLNNQL